MADQSREAMNGGARHDTDLSWLGRRPIAHRGWHGEGERSMERVAQGTENGAQACIAAARAGFDVECDVQISADGEAMVFHDPTLDRLTGETGPVHERTEEKLGRIKLPDGWTIPTLPQIRSMIDPETGLVIEIKTDGGQPLALTDRVAELVRRFISPNAMMSFDHRVLRRCAELGVPCGLVAEGRTDADFARHWEIADRAAFLSYRVDDLPNPFVAAFRASGRPVITWTVRTAEQVALTAAHADQMTFEGFDPDAGGDG